MAIFPYEYATIVQQGVEMGIIRCVGINFLAQFIDALAARHRPTDKQLVIWDGGFQLRGPEALTRRCKALDSSRFEWQRYQFTF